jgi:hypothetical protein
MGGQWPHADRRGHCRGTAAELRRAACRTLRSRAWVSGASRRYRRFQPQGTTGAGGGSGGSREMGTAESPHGKAAKMPSQVPMSVRPMSVRHTPNTLAGGVR